MSIIPNNISISESGTYSYDCTGQTWTNHITVHGWDAVSIYCFVYDADIVLHIDLLSSHTKVLVWVIVVSAKWIKSSLNISGNIKSSYSIMDIYALSLLWDNAHAEVNGGVIIAPDIIQTEWYLSEENILLGKKIRIKSLPMLDVRSNDVKASHGAKIDRLDEQKLFYLTAKWLPQSQAERLMIQSYIQKALDHASVEEWESIIEHIFKIL